MAISSNERQFFVPLGERIASQRKARKMSQTQPAEALGVSLQQLVARVMEMALARATR